MSLRLGGLVKTHDDQPPVKQRELDVHLSPEVRREPRGLVQIVAGTETTVAGIFARMNILHGDLRKALAQGNRNGRFATNADRVTVSTKPVVVLLLPAVATSNTPASLLKYRTEVTLSAGLGLVRHGPHEIVVDTWILGSTPADMCTVSIDTAVVKRGAVHPPDSPGWSLHLQMAGTGWRAALHRFS